MSGPNNTVYLSLGGNLGDPAKSMGAALRLLDADADTRVVAVSSLYRTPPWGKLDQPDFLNAAAEISTVLAPRALLELCLDAEHKLKRVREARWGPRLIDIDILVFGDRIIHEAGLEVPHPRMLERAFVLAPLAEIAPDLAVAGRSVSERLGAVDTSGIERLPSGRDWWLA
ncbi:MULTISPECIES: 2-amino-4-hydroxy-6-hydroxymethyldihydropteridine diphosphokinase [unclassified Mesorhizobium]|uniref:2-amino-4-hydroxy-6- hydroxymethyldihydropteridine diphosphokinase n=1 Tax=unclassified Mesorhizobium TaxID=325217 RepID=UPI000FDAA10D|nr:MULTISPECIES: 2-amino-4-hydroxy-6-hydroxymethyldihydropteridine diphosphokinase [unclassified Mesorhizobium]TGQ47927.1 2-amino-4-hydroxy-6-hydroxymethyldihydropteridine diphosphokinase [Mesorhizobium sp. M00.F.Ca.ET.216.01.1.1]TIS54980.1 MAG: 2-amino-4-hydroxy-6-hydroxymethyldihydropteridine diphosphokinase [Mesorhizobium sp.]TIS92031.1 MAG: 2-amino-4-hydroxy-6-hydroxymethyldihydropteridine diphosphokinase [Mesorhizobium sp.]TJW17802.1 MAG: 2-amino-4-hydroxy-6-hydroxymethyldihydropteridine d